jgi:Ala-tRNA(Pro) deacylase
MSVTTVKDFLDSRNVRYMSIGHSRAYTAQEVAAVAHVPGKEMAKTVVVNIDGRLAMAVLPANRHVDVERVRRVAGGQRVEIATESEFRNTFPGCELGAMPPFGNLYGMDVLVDESLTEDLEIAFNAGTHTELIVLPYADFARLVSPWVAKITTD